MKKVGGHFIADGNAVNIEIGFVPDAFRAWEGIEEGNPAIHYWYKECANVSGSYGQYGFKNSAGTIATHAAATNGFIAYDTVVLKAIVAAPGGSGETAATIYGTFAAAKAASPAVTPTARSTTVVGTIIRPTTANGLLYECTTSGGAMTALTEPTWGTTIGGTTSDGSNTWTCREEKLKNVGCKGLTLGATTSTDSDQWIWEAELYDSVAPERDAASYDPVGKHPND